MSRRYPLIERLGHARPFAAVMSRLAPPVDRALYGRLGGRTFGAGPPILLLTMVGRRSGEPRTVPLLYVRDGDRLAVAASNWGQERHPDWSENLLADPEARVRVGSDSSVRRARLATAEERERLWPRFVDVWPAYQTYERRSGRDIRIFVLESR